MHFVVPTILNFRKPPLIILVPLSGRAFPYFLHLTKSLLPQTRAQAFPPSGSPALCSQVLLGPCF